MTAVVCSFVLLCGAAASGENLLVEPTPIRGADAAVGEITLTHRPFRRQERGEKYTLTFTARADAQSHNSQVGFAAVQPDGSVEPLVGWTRSNGAWRFDARGATDSIPGQRDRFGREWEGGLNEDVTCRIVIDAGGHWVHGSIAGQDGATHRSSVYQLPVRLAQTANAVYISQDRRTGGGAMDVRHINVMADPAPPIVGTSPDEWRLPITIVELSWTSADTVYIRQNIDQMEQRPLDGVTVRVADPRFPNGNVLNGAGVGDAGWAFFQSKRIGREVIDAAIEDLRHTPFQRFRHNYLCMVTYLPGEQIVNWFDDDWWQTVLHNTRLLAEVAHQGGCEGIMFDPEEYGCLIWSAPAMLQNPMYEGRTYEELVAMVRQRGREFAAAVSKKYPGARFYVLHAWEDVLSRVADEFHRMSEQYRTLTIAFLDGMLEGSDDETIIMDGIENGYYVTAAADFAVKVDRVRRYGPMISAVPDLFRRKVRTATGIWLDKDRRWFADDPQKNSLTPAEYEESIFNALSVNDGFVWLYFERPTLWLDSPTAKLGGGIKPSTGAPNTADRDNVIKWIPRSYWQSIERARRRAMSRR